MELETLFSPGKIGNIQIKNRIVRSATYEHMADERGYVTDELIISAQIGHGGRSIILPDLQPVAPSPIADKFINLRRMKFIYFFDVRSKPLRCFSKSKKSRA